jgi:uncharacterized protein DUF928
MITMSRAAAISIALAAAMIIVATVTPPLLEAQSAAPVYKPPARGAPGGRIGGGTRGVTVGLLVSALVPDHVGQTVSEQPTVYWYLTRDASDTVEVALIDHIGTRPLIEHRLPPPVRAGIHALRLADHGVRLVPATPYQWSVAIVRDDERRSRDVLAIGLIERVELPTVLGQRLAPATPAERVSLYAEAGLWYDAIALLSERIDAAPTDVDLRRQRAALLDQVGLREAAAFDRR